MSAAPSHIVDGDSTSTDMFEVVWRGYDRDQVDHYLRGLLDQLESERQNSEQKAKDLRRVQNELAISQQSGGAEQHTNSFGHRVEKILRMAELEATEIRRKANEEATAVMEKARVEAEAYRHDAEHQLILRASNLDQEAARRTGAIQEREAEIAAEHAAAKQRADEMRSDAEREAERVRKHADALAHEMRTQAEKAAQEQRDLATREVQHLSKVQDEARSGIRRLHEMLAAELNFSEALSSTDSNGSEPGRSTAQTKAEDHSDEDAETQETSA
jgi:Skp family chaperone for outer membrane proteins